MGLSSLGLTATQDMVSSCERHQGHAQDRKQDTMGVT